MTNTERYLKGRYFVGVPSCEIRNELLLTSDDRVGIKSFKSGTSRFYKFSDVVMRIEELNN